MQFISSLLFRLLVFVCNVRAFFAVVCIFLVQNLTGMFAGLAAVKSVAWTLFALFQCSGKVQYLFQKWILYQNKLLNLFFMSKQVDANEDSIVQCNTC